MKFSVSVARRGLDLNLFAKNFQGEVAQRIVEETADFAFAQMYSNAPWRSGNLAMSIKKEVSEGKVSVKPLASYAIFVEKGTAPHIIRPVNASCLAFQSGMLGGMVFTRLVHHPGTKPNPFIQRTAMETRDEVSNIAKRVLDEAMGKATES
jgi:HK97 gp10 family phage protein